MIWRITIVWLVSQIPAVVERHNEPVLRLTLFDFSCGKNFCAPNSVMHRAILKKPLATSATDIRHLASDIYSNLSATIGSTFFARRAGTSMAASGTAAN